MGLKGKKIDNAPDEDDFEDDEQDSEVDMEELVQEKIKELPSLKEKIQAIAINGYLIQKRKLDLELLKQQQQVERKFRQTFTPFLDQINNIIQGKHSFSDSDFQQIGQLLTEQEQETKHNYFTNEKISQYWLKVFMNSEVIGNNVEDRDQPLLRHLEKVQTGKSEDIKRLWIDFYFSENEWFSNQKLHKEIQLGEEYGRSFGDQIKWKEGKNITVKIVKKKSKKKGGKKTKQVKEKSFFNLFLDMSSYKNEEEEEKQQENKKDFSLLSLQYDMVQALYSDIIPNSLEYYLGLVETVDEFGDQQDIEEEDEQEGEVPKKKQKITS